MTMVKVRDHNHITGKYQGSTHLECNPNLTKKILIVFHNFQNCDSHLLIQKIEKYNFKINFIPKQ